MRDFPHLHVIIHNAGFLLDGLKLSFFLTLVGISGGLVLGTLLTLIRQFEPKFLGCAVKACAYFVRMNPLVLVIFWIYFILPLIQQQSTLPLGP